MRGDFPCGESSQNLQKSWIETFSKGAGVLANANPL